MANLFKCPLSAARAVGDETKSLPAVALALSLSLVLICSVYSDHCIPVDLLSCCPPKCQTRSITSSLARRWRRCWEC
ncbi:hypothetical protein C8Q76DRAFT_755917 [Earliella scabrosa]|nr:hypothetical protein C8Q76DRAFT_755917 [Earliella scabrosa]